MSRSHHDLFSSRAKALNASLSGDVALRDCRYIWYIPPRQGFQHLISRFPSM